LRFDDRLQTMLAAPVADSRDRAVRWRQLVDLLSRTEPDAASAAVDAALDLVRRDAFAIDETVRAATIRAIAGRFLPHALLRILAMQPVRIAAPLFAGLRLSAIEAATILAEADDEVRALVEVEGPPLPATPAPPVEAPPPEPAPSISAMVERIEQLTQDRAPLPKRTPPSPPQRTLAPAASDGRLFEWESDASGHIAWVEGAPRGALVGRSLGAEGVGLLERQAAARLGQRHPFVDVPIALGDTLPGSWSATGVPAFDPATGRFLGYRGLARRTDGTPPRPYAEAAPDLDALREMVHEIKTPLNAIIGFAEIIDGQYLGPAHRRYRERAASIVGQARQLLEAVEDLDFAAKLRADRAAGSGGGARLAEILPPIAAELETCLSASGAILDVDIDNDRHRCALSPEVTVRLLRRLLLSLCNAVASGEAFRIAVTRRGPMCLLTIARPHRLDGLSEAQLVDPSFDPGRGAEAAGEEQRGVGLGFALRLVRGLAKVAGGSLAIDEHRITLELPAFDA
jgi:signal transduction histidine kinase